MKILDIGSGHRPHKDATHLCDLYLKSDYERCGNLVLDNRPFIKCSIENLPFKKTTFDFAYSCHVIEHTKKPLLALKELSRVSKAGYIECPHAIAEYLYGWPYHNWSIRFIGNGFIFKKKGKSQNSFPMHYLYNRIIFVKVLDTVFDVVFGLHFIRVVWWNDRHGFTCYKRVKLWNVKQLLLMYRSHELLEIDSFKGFFGNKPQS